MKQKLKKNKISANVVIECSHKNAKKPFCRISEINYDCIQNFKNNLSILESKVDQDKFLISMMSIVKPDRTDHRKTQLLKDRNTIKYFIPTLQGKIPICSTVFRSITSVTRKRLNIIANNYMKNNNLGSPIEKRGGSRLSLQDEQITNSIIDHI